MAMALARIESAPGEPQTLKLLDAAYAGARGHVVGLTGPPGVGKSSLTSRLIGALRAAQRTVGVIAVDPSSQRTGGALLGDRTRMTIDPEDQGVFVRSMANRGRLGGLAALTPAAMVLMRAVYDVVVVETVGVGQAETEVANVSDTVVFCIQPASGDSLQYLKAGLAEIPDVAVVTKADLGVPAITAENEMRAALASQAARSDGWTVPVVAVSASEGRGIVALIEALDAHRALIEPNHRLQKRREAQARAWLAGAVREEFGRAGLVRAERVPGGIELTPGQSPFRRLRELMRQLRDRTPAIAGTPAWIRSSSSPV